MQAPWAQWKSVHETTVIHARLVITKPENVGKPDSQSLQHETKECLNWLKTNKYKNGIVVKVTYLKGFV